MHIEGFIGLGYFEISLPTMPSIFWKLRNEVGKKIESVSYSSSRTVLFLGWRKMCFSFNTEREFVLVCFSLFWHVWFNHSSNTTRLVGISYATTEIFDLFHYHKKYDILDIQFLLFLMNIFLSLGRQKSAFILIVT